MPIQHFVFQREMLYPNFAMRSFQHFVVLSLAICLVVAAETPRARGVGPDCKLHHHLPDHCLKIVADLAHQLQNIINPQKHSHAYLIRRSSSMYLKLMMIIATAPTAPTSQVPLPAPIYRSFRHHFPAMFQSRMQIRLSPYRDIIAKTKGICQAIYRSSA